jgi:hypothetical protein
MPAVEPSEHFPLVVPFAVALFAANMQYRAMLSTVSILHHCYCYIESAAAAQQQQQK